MRDTLFPRWQAAFLALFLLADGLYLTISPQNISILLINTLLSVLITFFYLSFLSFMKVRDFEELITKLSKPIRNIIFIFVIVVSSIILVNSALRLSNFWLKTAFPGIPQTVTVFIFLFVAWRAGRRGRTATAMWAYPTLYIVGILILSSLIITLPDCTPEYLFLLPESMSFSIRPDFLAILPALLLCTQMQNLPSTKACCTGVFFGGIGLTLIALRAYLTLGLSCDVLNYPAFYAAGIFSVGDFLQRGEVLFGCAIVLCEAVRGAIMLTLIITCLRAVFPKLKLRK